MVPSCPKEFGVKLPQRAQQMELLRRLHGPKSVARGQEFILDMADYPEAVDWHLFSVFSKMSGLLFSV